MGNLVADIEGETRLGVLENRVVRKVFGSKREEGTGEWRRLHNEELYDLYCSQNIKYSGDKITKNEIGRERGTFRGEERCIQDFGGETLGKEPTWKT